MSTASPLISCPLLPGPIIEATESDLSFAKNLTRFDPINPFAPVTRIFFVFIGGGSLVIDYLSPYLFPKQILRFCHLL